MKFADLMTAYKDASLYEINPIFFNNNLIIFALNSVTEFQYINWFYFNASVVGIPYWDLR